MLGITPNLLGAAATLYGVGGSLSLESTAPWLAMVGAQERRLAPLAMARALRRLPPRCSELPLADLDERATGSQITWYREALANPDRESDYWSVRDNTAGVEKVTAPVQLIGGWHDIFLPWMLEAYSVLQRAGRSPQLIVGPWAHISPGLFRTGMREGIAWLRAHLLEDPRLGAGRSQVQILSPRSRNRLQIGYFPLALYVLDRPHPNSGGGPRGGVHVAG